VHLVVHNVAGLSKVDRVDDFIVSVFLVAIQVRSLTTMTYQRQGISLVSEKHQ
jgi:hypothetical protein